MDVENVVQEIEETIQLLTTTDCESNLKAIHRLEEASYKLWVESNTAFLNESILSTCTEEDSWIWDEECFFETNLEDDIWSLDGSVCVPDLSSSICSSLVSDCEDSFCSRGYLADAESSATCTGESMDSDTESDIKRKHKSTATRLKQIRSAKKTKSSVQDQSAKIESTSEELPTENDLDDEWVIVEESDRTCDNSRVLPVSDVSLHKEVVPKYEVQNDSDTAVEDEDDWTILSVKITEMSSVTAKHPHSESDFDMSRDSGITSPEVFSVLEKHNVLTTQKGYWTYVSHR